MDASRDGQELTMENLRKCDETITNLTQGDSRATVTLLQVGRAITHICGQCVMVMNGKKEVQLQVE
jgi:hypothetical protein